MKRTNFAAVGVVLAASFGMAVLSEAQALPANDRLLTASKLKGSIQRDVMEADDLMGRGKFIEASDRYRDAIKRNAKNVPAIVGLGMSLAKQFKLDAAEEQFDKAMQIDPNNAQAHVGKAMVLLNRLNSSSMTIRRQRDSILKEAENQSRTALNIDPYSPEAHFQLAQALKEQNRLDEAASEYNEAIKSDPKYSEAYAGLGLTKLAQGSLAEAESAFNSAIKIHSGNSTAHYGLGKTYLMQGRIDDALKELNTALYLFPNSWPTRLALGEAYHAQGNNVAAIKEYQESIRIKAENPDAYLRIADIREARGDLELSISELRAALELMPDNPELNIRVGENSLRLEKLDDAINSYQTVLNAYPNNAQAAKGITRAYYLKSQKEAGGAFLVSNEYENAKRMIDKAISLNPNDMELRLAAAKIRALSGETIDLSTIGTPTTDGERIAYAEALLAQNRFQEAQQQMNQVIAGAADMKQTFSVADLALMIKDLDSAEAAYRKAASYPGGEERAKRGLDLVAKAREGARQDLTLADDLAKRKQLKSAVDKYHDSVFGNPKVADTRMNLSRALERLTPAKSTNLREAAVQLKAFMALTPNLPAKEVEKLNKKVASLEQRAYKLELKEKSR